MENVTLILRSNKESPSDVMLFIETFNGSAFEAIRS
jgi:hypothetical protein